MTDIPPRPTVRVTVPRREVFITQEELSGLPLSYMGEPNGVATLDATARLHLTQLPTIVATLENGVLDPAQIPPTLAFSADVIPLVEKGAANGVATLDGSGTLTPAQIPTSLAFSADVIPLVQKGAASGVATLDATGRLTPAQIPITVALSANVIPLVEKGAANGVATLDGSGIILQSQLPPGLGTDPNALHRTGDETATGTKTFIPESAASVGFIVQGAASQSANLQEWRSSTTAVLAAITAAGALAFSGDTTLSRQSSAVLRVQNLVSDRLIAGTTALQDSTLISATGGHPSAGTSIYGVRSDFTAPATATGLAIAMMGLVRTAASSFAVGEGNAVRVETPVLGAGSAITIQKGVNIQSQAATGVSTSYGIDIQSGSGFTARISAGTNTALWLNSDTTSIAGGIALGTARDTTFFRNASGQLRTGGQFKVDSQLGIVGSVAAERLLSVGNTANHLSTATTLYGVMSDYAAPSTNTAASYWLSSQIRTAAANFTLGTANALYIQSPVLGAGSAITQTNGIIIDNQAASGVSGSYGMIINSGSFAALRLRSGTATNLWLDSDTASQGGGIAFGTTRDTSLYRQSSGIIRGNNFMADRFVAASTALDGNSLVAAGNTAAHPSTATTVFGVKADFTGPATATASIDGVWGQIRTTADTYTVARSASFVAGTPVIGAGSTVTEHFGMRIFAQNATGITTSYGMAISAGTNHAARLDGGNTSNLWLNSDTASTAGGIAWGTARDTGFLRSASGQLHVTSNLSVSNRAIIGNGQNAVVSANLLTLGNTTAHPGTDTIINGILSNYTIPSTATNAANGLQIQTRTAAATFTIGEARGMYVAAPVIGANSAVTVASGLIIESQQATGVAGSYGIIVRSGNAHTMQLGAGTNSGIWLNSDTASAAGGIAFGTTRDASLFRVANSQLHASTNLSVGNRMMVGNGGSTVPADNIITAGQTASHPSTATSINGIVSNYTVPATATAEARGLYGQIRTAASVFTLAEGRGLLVDTPNMGVGSLVTNMRGIAVFSQAATGVGTSYGVSVSAGSTHGIVSSGGTTTNLWLASDTNSIAGGIAFGTTRDTTLFRASAGVLQAQGLNLTGLLRWSTALNEQLTVGAAGLALPLPASPTKYLRVVDSAGTTLVIPAYAA